MHALYNELKIIISCEMTSLSFDVMYSGEYNVVDVTLSVYPQVASSIPTVVRQLFSLPGTCGYTLRVKKHFY